MNVQEENFTFECTTVPKIGDVKDAVTTSDQGCFVIQNHAETTGKFNDTLNQENLEYDNEKTNMGVNSLVPSSDVLRFVGWKDKLKPSENVEWYKCALCELKIDDKDVFLRHFKIIHEEKRFFYCKFCKYKSKNEYDLQAHVEFKHNENPVKQYNCLNCGLRTTDKDVYSRHFEIIHEKKEKSFECIFCKYKSKFKSCLQLHIKRKHSAKQKKIEQVIARLDNSQNQVMTDVINREENIIKVNLNSYNVTMKHQEIEVAEDVTIDVQKGIKCSEVLKIKYKSEVDNTLSLSNKVRFDIQNHEEIATGSNDILNQENCENHGEYNVTDVTVENSCSNNTEMNIRDDNVGAYSDNSKSLVSKDNLDPSENLLCSKIIHSEEDFFHREFCDYKSKSKHRLREHINLKHNESIIKLYNCPDCNLKTNYKDVFLRHFEIVHVEKEKWFQCVSCEYKSIFKGYLKYHIERKHSSEQEKIEQMTTQLTDTQNQTMTDVIKHEENIIKDNLNSDNVLMEIEDDNVATYNDNLTSGKLQTKYQETEVVEDIRIDIQEEIKCSEVLRIEDKDEVSSTSSSLNKVGFDPENCRNEEEYNVTDPITCEENIMVKNSYHDDIEMDTEENNIDAYIEDSKFVASKDNIKQSENVSWYICDQCELKTEYKDVFLHHFKITHEENRFFHCQFCKYKSKDKYNLEAHINSKHNESTMNLYNCPNCDLKTNYKDVYLRHFEIVHVEKEKWFQCVFCEYRAIFRGHLKNHVKKKHSAEQMRIEQMTTQLTDTQNQTMTDVIKREENIIKGNLNSDDVKTETGDDNVAIYNENLRSSAFKNDPEPSEDVEYESKLCELQTKYQETEVAEDIEIDIQEEIICSEVLKIEAKEEVASTSSSLDKVCFDIQNNEQMVTSSNNILNPKNYENDEEYNATDVMTCKEHVTVKNLYHDNTEMDIQEVDMGAYSADSKSVASNDNIKQSKNVTWYKCNQCELKTEYKDVFLHHFKIIHEEKRFFYCQFCKYKSKDKYSLEAHINSKHSESTIKPYNCADCDLETNDKDVFLRHFEIVHVEKEKLFQCAFCEYKSIFKGSLKRHVKQKHLAKQKKVEEMTTQVTDTQNQAMADVIKHEENVIKDSLSSDNVLTEIDDDTVATYNENLKSGAFKNDPEQSEDVEYESKLCELQIKYQVTEVAEGIEIDIKEEIECSEVLKIVDKEEVATTSSSLDKVCFDMQNNEQMVTSFNNILNPENYGSDKQYNATNAITCKKYVTVENVHHDNTEMDVGEDDIGAYSEDSKSLASKDNIKLSGNVSSYICDLCELKTEYKDVFLRHFKIIHEEKRFFHCEFCEYKYSDKYSLEAHINSKHNESTIKLYNCPDCDLKTNYKDVFLRHFEIVHVEKQKLFQCAFCEYKSILKGPFKSHVRQKHLAKQKKVEETTTQLTDTQNQAMTDVIKQEENIIKDNLNSDDVKPEIEDDNVAIYNENLRSSKFKNDPEPSEDVDYESKLCELQTEYQETKVAEDIKIDIQEKIKCSEVLKTEDKDEVSSISSSLDKVGLDPENCGNNEEYDAITCEEHVTVKNLYHDNTEMDIGEDDIAAYSEDSKSLTSKDNIKPSENVSWYVCNLCELKTEYKDVFLRHFEIRHEEKSTIKQYTCPHCGLETNHKHSLLRHFEIIHKKREKLFQCAFCKYKSKFKGHLQIHVDKKHKKVEQVTTRMKKNETFFQCAFCEYKSKFKCNLQRHVKKKHKKVESVTARLHDYHDRIVHDNNPTGYKATHLKLEENVTKEYVNSDDVKREVGDSNIVIYNENLGAAASKSNLEPSEYVKYESKLCELETKYQATEVAEDTEIDIKEEIDCSEVLKIEINQEVVSTSSSLDKVCFDIQNNEQMVTSVNNTLYPENTGNDKEYNTTDAITCEEHVMVKNLYHDNTEMDMGEDDIGAYSKDSKSVASKGNIEPSENVSWYTCDLCELKTEYKDVFLRHFRIIHEEKRFFYCKFCKYKSRDKYSLEAHINSKHNEKLYNCPECDLKTNYKDVFSRHFKIIHREEAYFHCEFCKYKSRNKHSLQAHIEVNHDENTIMRFNCSYCGLKTNYKDVFLRHFEIVHVEREKLFQCVFCEFKSIFKGQLQIHVKKKHKKVEQVTARLDDFHDRIVHDNNPVGYEATDSKPEEDVINDNVNSNIIKMEIED